MSIPTSQPIPDDETPSGPVFGEAGAYRLAARRRRIRRMTVPQGLEERAAFLDDLAYRVTPSVDFFIFSLISGLVAGVAILLNAPAVAILAAIVAPFMAPVLGLSLATVVGSGRFFLLSLGAALVGSGLAFGGGVAAGFVTRYWPGFGLEQAALHARFGWWDFALLSIGVVLTMASLVRSDQQPGVPSVAVVYGLYLAAGAAGFGLVTQNGSLWPAGLLTFGLYLAWSVFLGSVVLAFLGIRPFTPFGYVLGSTIALTSLIFLFAFSGMGPVLRGQAPLSLTMPAVGQTAPAANTTSPLPGVQSPAATASPAGVQQTPGPSALSSTATPTPTPTPTNTLIPSPTPTITPTLAPTPVWAIINGGAFNGGYIRSEPKRTGKIITSVLNGGLVQVLPEVVQEGAVIWVHVRTPEGVEGWVVQSLLVTATPAPGW